MTKMTKSTIILRRPVATKKLIQNYEKLIQTLEDENRHLKEEVEFLQSIIKPDNPAS